MSSILNALKKIEAESAAAEKVQVRAGKLRLQQGSASGPRRSVGWAVLGVGILLLLAAGGAWLVLRSSKVAEKPPVKSYRVASAPNHRPQTLPQRTKTGAKAAAAHPAGPPSGTQARRSGRHSTKRPPSPVRKSAAVHPSRPKNAPPARVHPAPRHPPDSPTQRIPLQDTYKVSGRGLTLQAIAWDPKPRKRFAVVNSRIMHEGQSIDGKMIAQIQRDAIIVRQGSERWKIVFR